MSKMEALAKFLGCDKDEIEQSSYAEDVLEYGSQEYMVLTDSEADEKAREEILDSVWAFRSEFLSAHLKEGVDGDIIETIQANGRCEYNNAAILSLIEDVDHFVEDAIAADGRGHFLSHYDGDENEQDGYYIYRLN